MSDSINDLALLAVLIYGAIFKLGTILVSIKALMADHLSRKTEN